MDLQPKLDDNIDGYGVPIPDISDGPLHEITWDMDKNEGKSVNQIKANNIAIPVNIPK